MQESIDMEKIAFSIVRKIAGKQYIAQFQQVLHSKAERQLIFR